MTASSCGKPQCLEVSLLRAFLLTASAGSTAAAAKLLGVSQPAISTSIRRLERSVGVPLFDRASRPMQLTAAGRILRSRTAPLIEDLDNLSAELKHIVSDAGVDLRIGFSDSFGACVSSHLVPRIVPRVHNLAAYCQSTPRVLRRLQEDELDIAIATKYPSEDAKISAQMVMTENFLIVTPKSFEGKVERLCDLPRLFKDLPVIRFNDDSLDSIQIERVLRQCDFHGNRVIAADTNQSVVSLVAHGIGWTVMPPLGLWVAREFLPGVALHRLESLRATRSFYAMHQSPAYGDLAAFIFKESIDILKNRVFPEISEAQPLMGACMSLSAL